MTTLLRSSHEIHDRNHPQSSRRSSHFLSMQKGSWERYAVVKKEDERLIPENGVLMKLNARTRTEAILVAIECGPLPPSAAPDGTSGRGNLLMM